MKSVDEIYGYLDKAEHALSKLHDCKWREKDYHHIHENVLYARQNIGRAKFYLADVVSKLKLKSHIKANRLNRIRKEKILRGEVPKRMIRIHKVD